MEDDGEVLPRSERRVEREVTHVARHRVEAHGHLPGLELLEAIPRVLHVAVLGAVVSVKLNVRRYGDLVPTGDIEAGLFKAENRRRQVVGVVEAPQPVEALFEAADTRGRLCRIAEPAVIRVCLS